MQQKHSMCWSLPKGSQLYPTESWQKCARRELAEETGLFVEIQNDTPCKMIAGVAFFLFQPSKSHIHSFQCLKTKDSNEISRVEWKCLSLIPDESCNSVLKKAKTYLSSITQPLDTLILAKKNKLISVCTRSKWIPTSFFSKKRASVCSTNWR